MIKIPYGQADFRSLITQGFFYQDRTQFIEKLELQNSYYPIFLRPRRFGKSLFISMLHCYYGVEYAPLFQKLFGNLYIGQHPTPLANQFFILSFNFSGVNTQNIETVGKSFLRSVQETLRRFLKTYNDHFKISKAEQKEIFAETDAADMLKTFFGVLPEGIEPPLIYVLIDEYDHFTNELLAYSLTHFKSAVTENGYVRKFFEVLKIKANQGTVSRIFITGVAPLTVDSLTSGYNISSDLTMDIRFHDMMGFLESEVRDILQKIDVQEDQLDETLNDLRQWYDGYRFEPDAKQHLYNTDMVLYFSDKYAVKQRYPDKMLDTNIASDYQKIANIFRIGGNESENFKFLSKLVEEGEVQAIITHQFNLKNDFTIFDVFSMLFYMGMTTFKSVRGNIWTFTPPNYVIKKLYFDYFTALTLGKSVNHILYDIQQAVQELVFNGDIEPFAKIVGVALQKAHSTRDKIKYGEKHLKTLMIGLLFPYENYLIRSEYETEGVFPDIFLERIPQVDIKHEVVIELKYIKIADIENEKEDTTNNSISLFDKTVEEGTKQIEKYMATERFQRPNIRGFCLVFVGNECQKIIARVPF